MKAPTDPYHVDVYPVGWLRAIKYVRREISLGVWPWSRRSRIRTELLRHTIPNVRRRRWHELKSEFNGYLAEPYHWPDDGTLVRCGSGWTRARAMQSLRRHGWRH